MNHIILFDLDGTLTDPKEGITKSVQHALRAYGIDEPDLDKLCPFIGPPLSDSFQEYYGFSKAQAREAIGHFHEYFTKQGMFENKVYPGIPEMLTKLQKAGITLAVATSKPEPFAIQILEHFNLLSYFTLVGGADMEEIRVRKGDVIAYTLDRLHTTPEQSKIIMVGDRKHDIIGAHENQLPCGFKMLRNSNCSAKNSKSSYSSHTVSSGRVVFHRRRRTSLSGKAIWMINLILRLNASSILFR